MEDQQFFKQIKDTYEDQNLLNKCLDSAWSRLISKIEERLPQEQESD
jgi:RNAse (barnase) inhibitor barstar